MNYPPIRQGILKGNEGDSIPLALAPHSSPSTGRGILRGIHNISGKYNGIRFVAGSFLLPCAHPHTPPCREELMYKIMQYKRIGIVGTHGIGKTTLYGLIAKGFGHPICPRGYPRKSGIPPVGLLDDGRRCRCRAGPPRDSDLLQVPDYSRSQRFGYHGPYGLASQPVIKKQLCTAGVVDPA